MQKAGVGVVGHPGRYGTVSCDKTLAMQANTFADAAKSSSMTRSDDLESCSMSISLKKSMPGSNPGRQLNSSPRSGLRTTN